MFKNPCHGVLEFQIFPSAVLPVLFPVLPNQYPPLLLLLDNCWLLCLTLLRSHGLKPARLLYPWNFPGQSTRVAPFLLQGIFRTQKSNPCLLHWQADSLPLSQTLCTTGLLIPQPRCPENLLCFFLPMFLCFYFFPVIGMFFFFFCFICLMSRNSSGCNHLLPPPHQSSSFQTYLFLSFWTLIKIFILSEVVIFI